MEFAETLLDAALTAVGGPPEGLAEALDALPAAVYVTDPQGRITHYNRACIAFAGRTPRAGTDQWCVTWKLYTTEGEPLPHELCPMAVAIRERREVRGAEALAERPDGSRVRFTPFPTPLYNDDGTLAGAVNMLIDITDRHRAGELLSQAARCRRLGSSALDRQTIDTLTTMADEYEAEAARLSRAN